MKTEKVLVEVLVPVAVTCAELVDIQELSTKMMMLWLSCLLIGSITCWTLEKPDGSEAPAVPNTMPRYPGYTWHLGRVGSSSSDSSSSLPKPSSDDKASQPSAPHVPSNERYNPAVGGYGAPYAASQSSGYGGSAPGGSYGGGYASSAGGYAGYGYGAPQDESSNSGSATSDGDETPEPVFSDVSDLEPVYAFSSRSRYQRGREIFAQTRYTPGEPVPPFPISRPSRVATSRPSDPAKAPAKGGY